MPDFDALRNRCSQVRRDILRMVHAVNSGHPGGSLGCTEFFVTLYSEFLEHDSKHFDMDGKGEDLFFLSNGHISPVWYATLARDGFFPIEELKTFRHLDSRLQGHPTTHEGLPGVRMSSGSLGQGLSVAVGAAMAKKLNNDDKLVYSLHGDGEFQEGQIWEALMFAAHNKVDNLISTMDYNNAQIDGEMEDVLSLGDIHAKIKAFGWDVMEMNGNDLEAVYHGIAEAKARTGKGRPVFVIMHTKMGYGVDFMEGSYKWHGVAPSDEQLENALSQLQETEGDF